MLVVAVCAVCVAVGMVLLYVAGYRLPAVEREGYVYVPTGTSYQALLDSLGADGGRVRNVARFDRWARFEGVKKGVRPGRYHLTPRMGYRTVARMFRLGLQTPVKVTFNHIRTMEQLAGVVARQLEPDSAAMLAVLTADTAASACGFTRQTFPAMFIPNTYEFYWTTSPAGFIRRMQREYEKFWNVARLEKLSNIGLTQIEAITLASIVYEETKMSDEMPVVAGVYVNRLRIGMPLQADPTVKYAVGDFTLRRVLNRHLEVDSPYNTYMYAGLPPGPITMPSIRAIDAVLDYRPHKYLFFCAKPDFSGYHAFAVTLAEHNRNRDAYLRALNGLRIYR